MPSTLKNMQFPKVYEPWFVYDATVSRTRKIERYDVLVADAATGRFVTPQATGDVDLSDGYVVALEEVAQGSGTQVIQVAMPGSVIPAVTGAANAKPGMAVKPHRDATHGTVMMEASAADIAAGRCIGRIRTQIATHNLVGLVAAIRTPILVQTGLV